MADQYLTPFLYLDENLVRVAIGPNGEPWFIAADVCGILGLKNVSKALQGLDEDEKGISNCYTLGGSQEHLTVSEAGIYTLIIRSHRPEARAFRRWVTHEVLPSIRRTGGYQTAGDRADKQWLGKLHEVRLGVAELRRSYGPRKAAELAVELWARVDVIVNDPKPPQGELNLEPTVEGESEVIDGESNIIDIADAPKPRGAG